MAIADVSTQVRMVSHWIGGKLVASDSGRSGTIWNPATGQAQAKVDFASAAEVDLAVETAKKAFVEWRASALSRRAEVMFKLRELVDANRRRIAELLTAEHGKTLPDAMGEVARGLENIEFACGIPNLVKGGFSEQASRGIDVYQIRQPLGVVAGITPFNFPAMVPMWMFANAIACGNTFILKPSEKDPSVSLYLAELMKKAACRTASSTWCRAIRLPWIVYWNIRTSRRSALLDRRPWRVQFMKREPAMANACRLWAARRITCWYCPMPILPWPQMLLSLPRSDRPASDVWPFRW